MMLALTAARAQQLGAASHVNPTPAGSLPVALDVEVSLAHLHPGASQGALACGAIVRPGDWIKSHRGELIDYASADKLVLSPAHYLGQSGSVPFALARGSYRGSVRFSTALSRAALTDPATRAPWSPQPAVLFVCWLTLNGHAAAWDPSAAPRVATAENTGFVAASPLVLAVQDLSGSGVSARASLHAQGNYFVPGAVAVAAQAGGAGAASASSATGAGPSNQPGQSGSANPAQSQASLNPQPISLQMGFDAAGSFQTPQPQSIPVQLTAGGSFVVPAAARVGASFAAAGAFTVPAPLALSLQLQSGGAFVVPAPVSTGLTLQAAGGFPPPAP
ncbi:MAG TPA: hypothetical protein VET66_08665 [Steroidobacteraceae bacterium]|nr:hypothetical protein [Steroidobacteraceae bacterium]